MPTDGLSQSQPASPNPDMMPSSQPSSAEWAKLAEVLGIQAAYSIQAHSPPALAAAAAAKTIDLTSAGMGWQPTHWPTSSAIHQFTNGHLPK